MTTRVIESDAREEERDEEREEERDEEREEDERWIDEESGGWDEDGDDAIPPRPRGRLLRPVPLALIAVIVAAAGFLGGVEAQKGSEGGSAGAAPGAGGLPGFAASKAGGSEAGGSESKAESSLAGLGGSSSVAATGTVTSVEGHTIYVKESDGTTVAVKVGDGATVTRDSNVAAKQIHPGDTVTVEGSRHGSTVRAGSVSATESGVETATAGLGAPGAGTGAGSGTEAETSVESLFEE